MRRLWLCICVVVGFATWVGGARAQLIEGTSGGDVLIGTTSPDNIYGYGSADTLSGKAGGDNLYGGSGPDTIECGKGYDDPVGNGGNDLIICNNDDVKPDFIDCGTGTDTVFWYPLGTTILSNCETVQRVNGAGTGDKAPIHYYVEDQP